MDLVLTADSRSDSSFAEQFLKEGIEAMTKVGSASRLACHSVLVKSLLCVKSLPGEQIVELGVQGGTAFSGPLRAVQALAARAHVRVGIFGSAALAIVTGLSYVHTNSDLDLVIYPEPGADLPLFAHGLDQLQKRAERAVDAELYLGDGYYGKLNEILAKPKSILIKGDRVPKLISYREVQNMLHGTGLKMK